MKWQRSTRAKLAHERTYKGKVSCTSLCNGIICPNDAQILHWIFAFSKKGNSFNIMEGYRTIITYKVKLVNYDIQVQQWNYLKIQPHLFYYVKTNQIITASI